VRYVAWLNTSPEWPKNPKKPEQDRAPEPIRREQIEATGSTVLLPPLGFGGHLVEFLMELGPVKNGAAIEPQDIPGWEYVLGLEFEPWEMRALIQLSRTYHMEMHKAKEWGAEPPYRGAANQWRWVRKQQSARNVEQMKAVAKAEAEERNQKKDKRNGNRQRH
jgi:hypothetical protein